MFIVVRTTPRSAVGPPVAHKKAGRKRTIVEAGIAATGVSSGRFDCFGNQFGITLENGSLICHSAF